MITRTIQKFILVGCGLMGLTACNGVIDGIYDEVPAAGQNEIYVDATDWKKWHYIQFTVNNSQFTVTSYDIPTEEVAEWDDKGTGIYTYWYDVLGEGISKREFRGKYPTASQEEPEEWDIAIHRNNVRTNGGAVYQTSLTSIDDVSNSTIYALMPFTEDEWNETDVWTIQERMTQGLVGNQGIKINNELGKWLTINIPPIPPTFNHNGNVFILRLKDGTYAALRLKNYKTPSGQNCGMTIEYRYPL